MKILNKIWGMGLLALLLVMAAPAKSVAQEGQYISEQEFYDELQPYGTWVYDPQYGNVWIPDVEEDFRPYATRGYWALTEYGNTWVSDYPWGWATFHYGRWHFDDYYGWEWVPGSEWAPAWVSWRSGGGYYGWAPMSPGVSIDLSFGNGGYATPDDYWVWAPQNYITYTNIYNYYVPYNRSRGFIHRTTYIRNRYTNNNHNYITGPRRDEIQRVVKRPVRVYNVNNVSRPTDTRVNNNTVNIYRPAVKASGDARPSRVIDGAAYKQQNPAQRIGGTDKSKGTVYNHANANKLAEAARNNNPDTKVVRVNNTDNRKAPVKPADNSRPVVTPGVDKQIKPTPADRTKKPAVISTAGQQPVREQQKQQAREPRTQQNQQAVEKRNQQQAQKVNEQRVQQQPKAAEQKRQPVQQQQPARDEQKAQQDQARQQQVQQAREQQQQQVREQQKQQQDQARQQQAQQAREQQQQQVREQQKQQQDQARQQQAQQAREQQQQQVREQQKQQQDQARQQQAQQAREQQQQAQQQQARDQQRQQQQARPQPQPAQPQHRPRS
jgi:hypothetical protein